MPESPAPAAPAIAILTCPRCGAAVPLGDGDELPCRHCGARVAVPAAHRALRDALRDDDAAVAAAEKLYAQLLRPAPPWQRLLASTRLFSALTLVLFAASFVALSVVAPRIDARVSSWLGARLRDTWDTFDITLWHTALLALAASPWLILVIGERRAAARAHLRAELAAAPAAFPGGERCCRSCGAPLVVRDGARGARCSYCRADNLVVGSDELQRRVAHRGRHVAGAVADARLLASWESVWLRRSLILRLGVQCVFFFIASGCELLTWRLPKDFGFAAEVGRSYQTRPSSLSVSCNDYDCWAHSFAGGVKVALRRGERLRVRVLAMPDRDQLARVTVRIKSVDSQFVDDWPTLADSELRAGEELTAQAPTTGWYGWSFDWTTHARGPFPDCAVEYQVAR